ncbi:putative ribonuclease H-like domain-containing protein, partial [Tanacetum coccineum]
YGPKTSKNDSEDTSNEVRESPDALMVEKLVSNDKLEKKIVFPTVAKIEFVRPKQQEKPVRKPVKYAEMYRLTAITIKGKGWYLGIIIQGPKAGYTARPNSAVVNAVRANQVNAVKASTLRNLIDDMLPLGEELNKGKLLVKELLKLTCDKKNIVPFTNTTCFVLSPDFKLANKSQVLLKVPRKNNTYSVDMKNIIPKESLTCLVAKATLDESMLWHRRLGHVNFKNINKLVKENLVRGLPSKHFENDQTCVAFLKGKQHKASFDKKVKIIRCDNGTEFKNRVMSDFCEKNRVMSEFYEKKGIKKEFSIARTPQQNGVAERRNMTLIEAAKTMVLVVKPHNKTPYELFKGRTPTLSFMRPFGCHDTILNTLDYLGKFDGKFDEGFFVGYSLNSDGPKWLFDIDVLTKSMNYVPVVAGTNSNDFVDGLLFDSSSKNASNDGTTTSSDVERRLMRCSPDVTTARPNINTASINAGSLNINTASPPVTTAPLEATHADFFGDETELDMSNITNTYLVPTAPNTRIHKDHLLDHVIEDVQSGDELLQFKLHKVWALVDLPYGKRDIRTKWVYRNKKDKRGIVIRNKARMVTQGYTQEEGIDYDEIEEEVYVCQPPGFEDPEFLDKVYKVEKALYGIHQAPRAWYETLSTYLLDNGFQRGQIDKTLFIKRVKGDILLVQVYVDDIIFGSTRNELCTEFEKMMHKKFQMSSMGELTFFLGLQVTQKNDEISISQDKYMDEILKKFWFFNYEDNKSMIGSLMYLTASRPDIMFVVYACARFQVKPKVSHLHAVKRTFRYLKGQPKLGFWYPKDSPFDLEAYSDSDYTCASLDRKSTTEVKNPMFHSKTKHIEIKHHFIRDSNKKKLIQMIKIYTDHNVANLLTKAFDVGRFQYLIASIGMLNL